MSELGVVVIGRNEGPRLVRCLQSLMGAAPVVYVDSGSTDASVAEARRLGAEVVELDPLVPFTAARARNEGTRLLLLLHPAVAFIQFVDGDCEVVAGWLETGSAALRVDAGLAVVCGRRRERRPEASIYNRLCDLEWDTPVGEASACGGDALFRRAAFEAAGGFRETLIAGEEPELCLRLRAAAWRAARLAAEMTRHDAAMTSFRQWRRRATRAGHAYAECAGLHGAGRFRLWQRERRSIWAWGCVWPLLTAAAVVGLGPWALLLLTAYPLLALKVWRQAVRRFPPRDAALYAAFCVLAKFPQAAGQIQYHVGRLLRRRPQLIEYKGPEVEGLA